MESRHLKIGYSEALNSKKQILTSELHLLQILKKIKEYGFLRKKEMAVRNKLKIQLAALRVRTHSLLTSLPEYKEMKIKKRDSKGDFLENRETKDIQKELEKIKKKLEGL